MLPRTAIPEEEFPWLCCNGWLEAQRARSGVNCATRIANWSAGDGFGLKAIGNICDLISRNECLGRRQQACRKPCPEGYTIFDGVIIEIIVRAVQRC